MHQLIEVLFPGLFVLNFCHRHAEASLLFVLDAFVSLTASDSENKCEQWAPEELHIYTQG